jgi:integrase-like protein
MGKFRDECLNEHWFLTLQEGQVVIEAWRQECEVSELTVRPGM